MEDRLEESLMDLLYRFEYGLKTIHIYFFFMSPEGPLIAMQVEISCPPQCPWPECRYLDEAENLEQDFRGNWVG